MEKSAGVVAGRACVAQSQFDVAAQHQRFGACRTHRLEALHEGARLEIIAFFVKDRGKLEQRLAVVWSVVQGRTQPFVGRIELAGLEQAASRVDQRDFGCL